MLDVGKVVEPAHLLMPEGCMNSYGSHVLALSFSGLWICTHADAHDNHKNIIHELPILQ